MRKQNTSWPKNKAGEEKNCPLFDYHPSVKKRKEPMYSMLVLFTLKFPQTPHEHHRDYSQT